MKKFTMFMIFSVLTVSGLLMFFSEIINMSSPIIGNVSKKEMEEYFLKTKQTDIVKEESESAFFTMVGEDKNKNGMRDDPERLIEFYFSEDKMGKKYPRKFYKGLMIKQLKMAGDIAPLIEKFNNKQLSEKEEYSYIYKYLYFRKFSVCVFSYINNDPIDVGYGNKVLHVYRKLLNSTKRRKLFGEEMIFQPTGILFGDFESNVFNKPFSETIYLMSKLRRLHDKFNKELRTVEDLPNCKEIFKG